VKDTGDELVTAFYSLAFQLYVHCPTALLLNPGLPLVGILRHAETMLMDENGQWCQQTLHFLRHLVTVREPVDDRPEEKKKLYHTWKQHGYDVLYRLLVTTFLRAFRGRWRKKNPTSIGLKMREDRHGTALLNIFEQSLARWPRTTTRWYKTWKHQVMDKDAMAAMVGDSDQSSGLLTMMAVLNQLTEIVKHHRLLQRLAAEEDNNAEDADGEEAMDDEGQAEASETTHSNRQGGNTMGQPEEANGMDA
jgi:hypothetical protein